MNREDTAAAGQPYTWTEARTRPWLLAEAPLDAGEEAAEEAGCEVGVAAELIQSGPGPSPQDALPAGIHRVEPGQRVPDSRAGDTVESMARQGVPHLPPGQAQRRCDLGVGPALLAQ